MLIEITLLKKLGVIYSSYVLLCDIFLFIFSMLQAQELGYETIHTNDSQGDSQGYRDSQGNTF